MNRTVQLKLFHGEHPQRNNLIHMLEQIASVSPHIELIHAVTEVQVREGMTFEILADTEKTGILFSGIPWGQEFNSLVLALLQAGGTPVKLDEITQLRIRAIDEDIHFETIISLDCHICPDVVQLLNQFALLNPKISNEMIDGSVHLQYMEERNIQGVPTVLLNKKPFSSGKITTAEVLDKISELFEVKPVKIVLNEKIQDVVVIGGGPAASSAAIYTARKGLKVTVIAEKIGGQISDTKGIDNLIATPQTTGEELVKNLQRHINDYKITVKEQVRVESVEVNDRDGLKYIHLNSGEILKTQTVIIATGAKWRELGVPGEKENIGSGVAYCPHCDGPFFKGKNIAVVGGGNSGVEAALDLSLIAKSVTVLEYLDSLKADQVLVTKLHNAPNIQVFTGVAVQKIIANNGTVSGVELKVRKTKKIETHELDGVFVQIGLLPNSSFVKDLVKINTLGEIEIDSRCQTPVDGVFACGDVTTVPYKQIIISMGEGAKAGLSAAEYILKKA